MHPLVEIVRRGGPEFESLKKHLDGGWGMWAVQQAVRPTPISVVEFQWLLRTECGTARPELFDAVGAAAATMPRVCVEWMEFLGPNRFCWKSLMIYFRNVENSCNVLKRTYRSNILISDLVQSCRCCTPSTSDSFWWDMVNSFDHPNEVALDIIFYYIAVGAKIDTDGLLWLLGYDQLSRVRNQADRVRDRNNEKVVRDHMVLRQELARTGLANWAAAREK